MKARWGGQRRRLPFAYSNSGACMRTRGDAMRALARSFSTCVQSDLVYFPGRSAVPRVPCRVRGTSCIAHRPPLHGPGCSVSALTAAPRWHHSVRAQTGPRFFTPFPSRPALSACSLLRKDQVSSGQLHRMRGSNHKLMCKKSRHYVLKKKKSRTQTKKVRAN